MQTISLDNCLDNFLNYLIVEKGLSKNTVESYSRDLQKFLGFIEKNNIADLDKTDNVAIMTFLLDLKEQGLSSRTTGRNLSAIRMFFRFLMREEMVKADPTVNIESPKIRPHLPSVLNVSEVDSLLSQPDSKTLRGLRDKTMLELLYATGIRVTELVSLKLTSINLEVGFLIAFGKGSKERIIPLGETAQLYLKEYITSARPKYLKGSMSPFLFLNASGKNTTTKTPARTNKTRACLCRRTA